MSDMVIFAMQNQGSKLMTFMMGVFTGLILFILLYILAVIIGIKKTNKKQKERLNPIIKKEVKWITDDCKTEFKNERLRKEYGGFKYFKIISIRMIKDIASKFNPKSKMPHLEISIDEIIVLTKYISERIDEILNNKILRLFRNMTIKRIIDLKNMEKKIKDSSIVKGAKLSGADKLLQVLKVFNPVYWFKKGVFKPIITKIIFNMALNFIEIIGEEAYNVYSKAIFLSDIERKEMEEENLKKIEELNMIYEKNLSKEN